ncbi:hypothetical protein [Roseococcus pinisoli]|uniref:Uncharacterized protein n=1 Tax=Roseococcus pinisoli TaxID=2835040 RepID=A0ABS5QCD7_9PROT|nr:hypothetical protein [Roseococcus pinisoli]MBS7811194.1 hypothetical protein [Roseococcus pinisoli]
MSDQAIALPSLKISQPLAEAIRDAAKGAHPEAGLNPLAPSLRPEAEKAHARLNAILAPSDPAVIVQWIAPLAALLGSKPGTPKGEELRINVQAMAMVLADLPACCWTAENQRSAGRQFQYWPSPKEITDVVLGTARPFQEERLALARLLRIEPRRGSPEERAETPEEKAAHAELNRATVQALKDAAAQREREATPSGGKLGPNTISAQQRIATYRRLGQHAVADAIARSNGLEDAASPGCRVGGV